MKFERGKDKEVLRSSYETEHQKLKSGVDPVQLPAASLLLWRLHFCHTLCVALLRQPEELQWKKKQAI